MTTMVSSSTLGLERVARECLIMLMDVLNDELPAQDAAWAELDEDLATRQGIPYVPLTLEPVEPNNFYLGHRPSLIEAPVDKYPNVSVMADRAGPSESDSMFDHGSEYDLRLYIELMVRSLTSEEEVNARVQRMADAVNICMMSNRTLRGVVTEIDTSPTIAFTEVFIRKERPEYGREWFWQGARLEYVVTKMASLPSGSFARPATMASAPSVLGADIDQS